MWTTRIQFLVVHIRTKSDMTSPYDRAQCSTSYIDSNAELHALVIETKAKAKGETPRLTPPRDWSHRFAGPPFREKVTPLGEDSLSHSNINPMRK